MPWSWATLMTSSPTSACISTPSTVTVTRRAACPVTLVELTASQGRRWQGRRTRRSRPYGEDEDAANGVPGRPETAKRCWSGRLALALLHMSHHVIPEELVQADDGRHGRRAQWADRGLGEGGVEAGRGVVADVEEAVEVGVAALAVLNAVEDLLAPPGAFPAGGALAAALVGEELGQPQRHPHRAGVLVVDHDRPRPEHDAVLLGDEVHVEGHVEVLVGQPLRRRTARDEELDRPGPGQAAAEVVDQLAEGKAQLELVVARLVDVA